MSERRRASNRSGVTAVSIFILSCLLLSCASSAGQHVDPATWQAIHRALEDERRSRPDGPWAAGVLMTMREPRTGRTIDGRGAIAVSPGRAMRMILVGAAGATMLDAWVTPERWRIAVPPAGVLRRGGGPASQRGQRRAIGSSGPIPPENPAEEPSDLPVGFLRWLFFRPLAGTLFGGSLQPERVVFLLRDDDAVLEVRLATCPRGKLTTTTRRAQGRSERLEECRGSGAIASGDWVRYEDEATGLRVALTIESVAAGPPDPQAFRDPDADGT